MRQFNPLEGIVLSSAEQTSIQGLIDTATSDELESLRAEAEATLTYANAVMGTKLLSREESNAIEVAIEILTRLDARKHRGGWWYRAKRRPQLLKTYLGG